MPSTFAPNDLTILKRLRDRIEGWDINAPRSQFQQYGTLNAFLSIKFPPANFLAKPQAPLCATFSGLSSEDAEAVRTNVMDRTMDDSGAMDVLTEVEKGRLSLDSNNDFVGKERKSYPDCRHRLRCSGEAEFG
ncbi:hypothetical protein EDC04DRAFT_1584670 [Pisolithus marmoratus]|nr:hypothetical protein EDC04DRAFT_1584670 [Pisolithus marmoratus]